MTVDLVIIARKPIPIDSHQRLLRKFDARGRVILVTDPRLAPMEKRGAGFQRSKAELVVFLDEDVTMRSSDYEALLEFTRSRQGSLLISGAYSNPSGLNASGRAYNHLCRTWVLSAPSRRFLGGAFALWRAPHDDDLFKGITDYGGEEERFAERWQKCVGRIEFCPGFCPEHDSQTTSAEFFQRARRQGRAAREKNPLKTRAPHTLWSSSFSEKPWLLIHMLGVAVGGIEWRIKARSIN